MIHHISPSDLDTSGSGPPRCAVIFVRHCRRHYMGCRPSFPPLLGRRGGTDRRPRTHRREVTKHTRARHRRRRSPHHDRVHDARRRRGMLRTGPGSAVVRAGAGLLLYFIK